MKRSALKPKRKRKPGVSWKAAVAAIDRDGGWCVSCGNKEAYAQLHHLLPRQKFPDLIDEPANLIVVCSDCHERHENASRRFSRALCRPVEGLHLTPPMKRYLDSIYGPLEAERDA